MSDKFFNVSYEPCFYWPCLDIQSIENGLVYLATLKIGEILEEP